LDLDHLNEALWRSGMRLAYGAGSAVDALNLYRRCAARLAEELGVEPETETRELAEAIGRGEVIPIPSRPDLLPKERLHLLQVVFMGEGALGVRHIAAVLGLTDVEVADGLAELQRGDWLDDHLNVRGHHLATLRRSIAPSFKRLLHERIAEELSTSSHVDEGVVARHLLAAFDPHAAAPRLVVAATTAIDNAAFDEATGFLFQAGWAAYELPALRLEAHVLLEGVASQRGDGALQEAALASAEA